MSDSGYEDMERVQERAKQEILKGAYTNEIEAVVYRNKWLVPDTILSGPSRASYWSKNSTAAKLSRVLATMEARQSSASPNVSEPTLQDESLEPINKVGEVPADLESADDVKMDIPPRYFPVLTNLGNRVVFNKNDSCSQSGGVSKVGYPMKDRSSFTYQQRQQTLPSNESRNNKLNGQNRNVNETFKVGEKLQRSGQLNPDHVINRGPRARGGTRTSLPTKKNNIFGFINKRDKCNLPDFKIKYENAKFFVIKSYTEVDIHNSIKYDVWSSTTYGNRKLDAVYQDASTIYTKTGKTCPIFLFFSANGSGQFVGLAEMIGPVDFKKDMDFWHHPKWNGFFPVKWHIIKDIPNHQLRHIVLKNNDNKPVTFTRDTHEIELKQGLEMLAIFKSYHAKTMLLDDFDFYEDEESASQKTNKVASQLDYPKAEVRKKEASTTSKKTFRPNPSMISLRDLALKYHAAKAETERLNSMKK